MARSLIEWLRRLFAFEELTWQQFRAWDRRQADRRVRCTCGWEGVSYCEKCDGEARK